MARSRSDSVWIHHSAIHGLCAPIISRVALETSSLFSVTDDQSTAKPQTECQQSIFHKKYSLLSNYSTPDSQKPMETSISLPQKKPWTQRPVQAFIHKVTWSLCLSFSLYNLRRCRLSLRTFLVLTFYNSTFVEMLCLERQVCCFAQRMRLCQ